MLKKELFCRFSILFYLPLLLGCGASKSLTLYTSEDITIDQIGNHTYVHTSFLQTENYGKVKCNGLIIVDAGEALILDTPTTDKAAKELIYWVTEKIKAKVVAVVPTHFHKDCLGSLPVFHEAEILSIANNITIQIAKEKDLPVPSKGFSLWDKINVGTSYVELNYLGPGHTKDNIVAYFGKDDTLFGGCLVKAINAGKGNLADANTREWVKTLKKVKRDYPDTYIVVPGHGQIGDQELLDYTIALFDH